MTSQIMNVRDQGLGRAAVRRGARRRQADQGHGRRGKTRRRRSTSATQWRWRTTPTIPPCSSASRASKGRSTDGKAASCCSMSARSKTAQPRHADGRVRHRRAQGRDRKRRIRGRPGRPHHPQHRSLAAAPTAAADAAVGEGGQDGNGGGRVGRLAIGRGEMRPALRVRAIGGRDDVRRTRGGERAPDRSGSPPSRSTNAAITTMSSEL